MKNNKKSKQFDMNERFNKEIAAAGAAYEKFEALSKIPPSPETIEKFNRDIAAWNINNTDSQTKKIKIQDENNWIVSEEIIPPKNKDSLVENIKKTRDEFLSKLKDKIINKKNNIK